MKNRKLYKITVVSVFSALSAILYMYLKFPLPFMFPSFLDIQLSTLPAIIITLMFSKYEGISVIILKTLIKLLIQGTTSAYIGELGDIILGVAVVLALSKNLKKGIIKALIYSCITWVIAAAIINYFILVPTYIKLYFNDNVSNFIKTLKILPNVNENNYMILYLLLSVIPFNIILSSLVSFLSFIIYKRIPIIYEDNI